MQAVELRNDVLQQFPESRHSLQNRDPMLLSVERFKVASSRPTLVTLPRAHTAGICRVGNTFETSQLRLRCSMTRGFVSLRDVATGLPAYTRWQR
jgi:hypothetical protein